MFSSSMRSPFSSKPRSLSSQPFPRGSGVRSNSKYYTPFKSNLTTMNTNHNTLSLHSTHHPRKFFNTLKDTTIDAHTTITKTKSKQTRSKKGSTVKQKAKAKFQKKNSTKVSKKPSGKTQLRASSVAQDVVVSNRQLYKGLRESLNYESTSLLLSKISAIFDLVLQQVKLPYEVQTFLYHPLELLKQRLQQQGRRAIGQTLTEFKDSCMQVFRNSSSAQIALFHRMQLPRHNRWQSSSLNDSSVMKRQQEMQNRLSLFQSLKKKGDQCQLREDQALGRIESRLDDYLCRSVKYRKVYL